MVGDSSDTEVVKVGSTGLLGEAKSRRELYEIASVVIFGATVVELDDDEAEHDELSVQDVTVTLSVV